MVGAVLLVLDTQINKYTWKAKMLMERSTKLIQCGLSHLSNYNPLPVLKMNREAFLSFFLQVNPPEKDILSHDRGSLCEFKFLYSVDVHCLINISKMYCLSLQKLLWVTVPLSLGSGGSTGFLSVNQEWEENEFVDLSQLPVL